MKYLRVGDYKRPPIVNANTRKESKMYEGFKMCEKVRRNSLKKKLNKYPDNKHP